MNAQDSAPDGSQALSAVSRCEEVRLDKGGVDTNGGKVLKLLTTTLAVLDEEQLEEICRVCLHGDGGNQHVWRYPQEFITRNVN